ncbi:hypothetical protein [Streptosporangium sp. NPDC000396]|uniref:hypothetical protein n=1 Tax=Streptosporangium sp. NPDC000396 TaxID=3366185 RepID=UPI0036B3035D
MKDPAGWPLAALKAVSTKGDLEEKADKALARIQVGPHDLTPWINAKGTCGLADHGSEEWSLSIGLDQSGASTSSKEGFAGPRKEAGSAADQWITEPRLRLMCGGSRVAL